MLAIVIFSVYYFLSNALSSSLPLVTHNLGVAGRHSSSSTAVRAVVVMARNCIYMFRIFRKFPSLASNRSRRPGFHATHQTQYNTRRLFCG